MIPITIHNVGKVGINIVVFLERRKLLFKYVLKEQIYHLDRCSSSFSSSLSSLNELIV